MGILTRAIEKRARVDVAIKPAETPPAGWTVMGGMVESGAGVTITPEMSMQISAVYACVRNLAEDVAKLPLIMYKRSKNGKDRAPEHPVYSLLHDMPNPEMTSFDMRSTLQGHVGGRGNGYAYIEWDTQGKITELWPLRPDCMIPYRDMQTHELVYEYTVPSEGVVYHWPKERVLHLHGMGFDGLMGYNPVQMQMRSQGLAWATEEFGSRFFGNGARPGIVYKHPGQLSDQAFKHLNDSFNQLYTGLERSHRVRILEEGMGVETIGTPPEEAQFLETRKFQVTEIARWYRMPPHKIADLDRATFSNIEEQSLEYVTDALLPWLIRWEQAIYQSLLLPRERSSYFAEHLMESMLRGKTLDRYQAYHLALTDGWMNRNEVRESENRNQVSGLDEYLAQLNLAPAGGRTEAGSVSVETARPVVRDLAERASRRALQDLVAGWARFSKKSDLAGFTTWRGEYLKDQAWAIEHMARPAAKLRGLNEAEIARAWSKELGLRFDQIILLAETRGIETANGMQLDTNEMEARLVEIFEEEARHANDEQ